MASFPSIESLLNLYFIRVVAHILIAANLLRFLVSVDNKAELNASIAGWNEFYPLATNPSTSTTDNVANKDKWKERMLAVLRLIYADIPNSALNATDRSIFMIPIVGGPHPYVPMPECWPIGAVFAGSRLSHTITYKDSITGKKAKPYGVKGCEIWYKIGGTEPVSVTEMIYLATIRKTPFVINYDGIHGGLKVYYWIRWIDSKNKGKWSPCISGTIMP